MSKPQAKAALRAKIVEVLGSNAAPAVAIQASGLAFTPGGVTPPTLAWFIENRWRPLREGTWRGSTPTAIDYIFSHILKRFGDVPLDKLDAVQLQVWLNDMATRYSASLVKHLRHYIKSICAEAVEQDYLRKSPARLLRLPHCRPVAKPFLTMDEIRRLIGVASGRDRLLLWLCFTSALRPSELFGLRWRCLNAERRVLRITESVVRGVLRAYTKTTDNDSAERLCQVFLPDALVGELLNWRASLNGSGNPDAFIFGAENGQPMRANNYERRTLKTLARMAGIEKLNFQILRRTVATHLQHTGSPQDIATVLRHTNATTAVLHYTQPVEATARASVEKFSRLLGECSY